jgi:hypothetical protein
LKVAKKAAKPAEEPMEEAIAEEAPKAKKGGNLSEPKSVRISARKYLQLHGEGIHKYTQAYVVEAYRGIMKTKTEWDEEIKKVLGG